MQIALRNIKFMASMSEETNCYSADLIVDGQLIAHVGNRGHGGCDEQRPAKGKSFDAIMHVENWIKANVPARTTDFKMPDGSMFVMEPSLESICGDLLAEHLATKELTRLLKRTVVYIDGTSVMTFKGKLEGARRDQAIAHVRVKKPAAIVLNSLPFDDALKAYRAASVAA